jgi:hypothetical protein
MEPSPLHPAEVPVERLLRDCEIRFGRRSGPGGQHRNKVETAVVLTHRPTGIRGEGSERRSQLANRRAATQRLRLNLALQVRCERPPESTPSQLWQSRCRGGRAAVGASHGDFPALLAELLDVLAACEMDVRAAADRLNITPSQVVKTLRIEPRALLLVNQLRGERGQHPLR